MQSRRVILTIETETDEALAYLKSEARLGTVHGHIKQVQVNVVQQPKAGKKKARR